MSPRVSPSGFAFEAVEETEKTILKAAPRRQWSAAATAAATSPT